MQTRGHDMHRPRHTGMGRIEPVFKRLRRIDHLKCIRLLEDFLHNDRSRLEWLHGQVQVL